MNSLTAGKDINSSLAEFLNKYCDYVSKEEQAEIDAMNIDYDDLDGEELDINELL